MINNYFHRLSNRFLFKVFSLIGVFLLVSGFLHQFIAKADQNTDKLDTSYSEDSLFRPAPTHSAPILLAKNSQESEKKEELYRKAKKGQGGKKSLDEKGALADKLLKLQRDVRDLTVLEPTLKAEVITVTKMASTAQTAKERRIATKKIRNAENNYIALVKEIRDLKKRIEVAKLELQSAGTDKQMIAKIQSRSIKGKEFMKRAGNMGQVGESSRRKPQKIVSKKAKKESKSIGALASDRKKGRFPWFRKEKKEDETPIAGLEPMDQLEQELLAQSRKRGDSAKLSSRKMQFPKSLPDLKGAYEKALNEEAEACLQLINAYTSTEIPKYKEISAEKEYREARGVVKGIVKEFENRNRNSLKPRRG